MLDIVLWIAQGFLALFFSAAGAPKVIGRGIDRWVGFDSMPRSLVIVVGVAEVAAAVALVVPMLLDVGEWTTPAAAIGVAVVGLMASGFHIRHREWLPTVETTLLASLAAAVAVGRWELVRTGPSVPGALLGWTLALLLAGTVVNLVLVFRQPVPHDADSELPVH